MAVFRRVVCTAAILAAGIAVGVSSAFAIDLGRAKNFAVLAGTNVVIGPGAAVTSLAIGAQRATIGAGAFTGDVVTDPGGIILGPGAVADSCITDGAKVKVGKSADCDGSIDTSGTNPELSTLSGAIVDASTFAADAQSQTPTQTVSAIKIAKDGSQTITDTVSGNLNVISVPSVSVGNGAQLIVSGGSSDTALMLVAGNLKVAPGADLDTRGGLPQTSLLILVLGKSVSIGRGAFFGATVLAPNANCIVGPGESTEGALLCGKHISVNRGADVSGEASTVTLP